MPANATTPIWKGLVLEGLQILRAIVHLNGAQSDAWDTVVGIIQAL